MNRYKTTLIAGLVALALGGCQRVTYEQSPVECRLGTVVTKEFVEGSSGAGAAALTYIGGGSALESAAAGAAASSPDEYNVTLRTGGAEQTASDLEFKIDDEATFGDVEKGDRVDVCFQTTVRITYEDTDGDGEMNEEVDRRVMEYEFVRIEH